MRYRSGSPGQRPRAHVRIDSEHAPSNLGVAAVALASLNGRQSLVDTLFIDEGFGSLDSHALDTAIGAIEKIQNFGRKVGIITHLDGIKERVPVQVVVEKIGAGRSRIRIQPPVPATCCSRLVETSYLRKRYRSMSAVFLVKGLDESASASIGAQTVGGCLLLFVTIFDVMWCWQRLEAAGNRWNEEQR